MKNKKATKKKVEDTLDKDEIIKHIFKTKEKDIFNVEYNNLLEELKSNDFSKIKPFILSNFIQSKTKQLDQHQEFIKEYLNDQEPGKLNIKELIDLEDFKGAKEIMLKKLDFNLENCKDLIKEDLKKLTFLTKKRVNSNNSNTKNNIENNNMNDNEACSLSISSSSSSSSSASLKENGNKKSLNLFIKRSSDSNSYENENDEHQLNDNNIYNENDKGNEKNNDSDFDFKRERFFGKSELNNKNSDFNVYPNTINNNKNYLIDNMNLKKKENKAFCENKNSCSIEEPSNKNNSSNNNQDSNKNTITIKDEEPPEVKIKLTYADGKDSFPQYLSISTNEFQTFDEFLSVFKKKLGIYQYARFKLLCILRGKECYCITSVQHLYLDRVNEIKLVPEDYDF